MSRPRSWLLIALCLGAAPLLAAGASGASPPTVTVLAVGDVASCEVESDERVAELVARTPGTLALLGDIAYESGTPDEFARCFMPSWARFLPRTRATLGNHEYANGESDASTARAILRVPADTWYSFELGAWHVIVLDSNCAEAGGCNPGTRQWLWLRRDLRQHRGARCTLALWHHPRFSSGLHGSDRTLAPFWTLLAAGRADVVLSGHDHDYERFAPVAGIRSFVVGTGGRGLRPFHEIDPRSVARQAHSFGILRLTLRPRGYGWRFLTAAGPEYVDAGSAACR
jgi:calcineurin-like phosphoesterase family protein